MSSKGILTGGRALTKLIQQDSALGTLIQKIINGVNSVATNTATSAVGKIPPPPSPNSINVTTPGGFMQVTVNHSSEIQKGIQYITHVGTDPDFVNPPIVVDHGSSRSPAPFALPIVDHTGTAINYYVRTLAQYQGSDASTPTIFGVGAPTPITLNGATNTLQPGTGSGTGSTSGQQSLVGLGKVQRTSSGTNPSGGVQTGGGIPAPPTPSGTAGGDLSGSYPNPQVASTHLTAPLPVNQGGSGTTTPSLIGAGTVTISGSWPDQTVTGATGGITQLTGDVTAGPGSGSQVATLANTAVTPGSYTSANITVDAKGRLTAAASGGGGTGTVTHTAGALTSGQLVIGNGSADIKVGDLTGDVTTSGATATTIAANAVTTTKINNAAVTLAKIANAAANSKLLGSGASGSGAAYSELTLGTNLSMSGTTLNAASGAMVNITGSCTLTNATLTGGNAVTTGAVASVTISVIPGTYTSLKIIGTTNTTNASGIALQAQFNADTANHYIWQQLFGNGATASANASGALVGFTVIGFLGGTAAGNTASNFELTIPNYTNTTFNKAHVAITQGWSSSTQIFAISNMGVWQSTAAITSITIFANTGNIVTGSIFTIYGIQ